MVAAKDCSEFTGVWKQVCEGRLKKSDGRSVVISQNARTRLIAAKLGEPIPPRDKGSKSTLVGEIEPPRDPEEKFVGVGTELHNYLESKGVRAEKGCDCLKKVALMDARGIAWCERNRDDVVDWLIDAAEKRLKTKKSPWLWIPESMREAGERIGATYVVNNAIAETKAKVRALIEPISISVAITTAPRQGPNLLPRCVRSVLDSGFDDVTIYAEPHTELGTFDAPVVMRERRLGAWHNWMQTVEDTLAKDTEYVLIVQDDCVFAKGVRDFISAIVWPSYECSAIQLCCSSYYRNLPNGLCKMPGTGMIGAWATLMPRFHAQLILDYGRQHGWRGNHRRIESDPVKKKAIDDYIGYASEQLGFHCRICKPSVVLHDADYSSLNHGDSKGHHNNRKTINWIGEDALAIDHVPIPRERVKFQT